MTAYDRLGAADKAGAIDNETHALSSWVKGRGRWDDQYTKDGWRIYSCGLGARPWRAVMPDGESLKGKLAVKSFATAGAAAMAVARGN